ncbi:succinate dehydrogenase assembly factor 2 [Sphingomonadaceae bacterium]|nr:succinate dehydrogenase assembly factor 2 [Sphingomonadaceae bacterium]
MPEITPDHSDSSSRVGRAKFRAWHRGTREADYMIGGFFDRYHAEWGDDEMIWFEKLLAEDDVDVMAWAMKTQPVPDHIAGPMMDAMMRLDYVDIPR